MNANNLSNLKSLYLKATEHHKSGNFKEALSLYSHILSISPLHYKSHFKIASLHEKGYDLDAQKLLVHSENNTNLLAKAFSHYEKAAELGYDVAQFNLGVMLMTGKGTEKNEEKAIKWLRIASENGSKRATVVLEKVLENKKNDSSQLPTHLPQSSMSQYKNPVDINHRNHKSSSNSVNSIDESISKSIASYNPSENEIGIRNKESISSELVHNNCEEEDMYFSSPKSPRRTLHAAKSTPSLPTPSSNPPVYTRANTGLSPPQINNNRDMISQSSQDASGSRGSPLVQIHSTKKNKDDRSVSSNRSTKSLNSSKHFSAESLMDIQELELRLSDAQKELKEKSTNMKLLDAERKRDENIQKKKIGKLESKIKLLEKKLQDKDKIIETTLQGSKNDFQKLVDEYETRIQEGEEKILAFKMENEILQQEVEKHIIELKRQLDEKDDIIENTAQKLHQAKLSIQSLEEQLAWHQQDFARKIEAQKQKSQTQLEDTNLHYQQEIERLKVQLSDAREFHKIEIQSLSNEKNTLNEEFAEKKKEYLDKIDSLMEDLRSQKQKQLHDKHQRELELKSSLDIEKRQLLNELQKVKEDVNRIVDEKMEDERKTFKKEYESLHHQHREAIATLEIEHKEILERMKEKIQALQDEILNLRNNSTMATKLAENEQVISELKDREKEAQRIIANISRQNVSFIETIELNAKNDEKLREKIALQEKKIKLLENKCRQTEAHIEHLKSEVASLPSQNDVDTIKYQSEKLQQIIIQQFDKIQEQNNIISKLEEKLRVKENQIHELTENEKKMTGTKNQRAHDVSKHRPTSTIDNQDDDPLASLMSEGNARSKAFEDEYVQMVNLIQSQKNGDRVGSQWQNILNRLSALKREYNLNIKQHQNQIHDVIQYCLSLRE